METTTHIVDDSDVNLPFLPFLNSVSYGGDKIPLYFIFSIIYFT